MTLQEVTVIGTYCYTNKDFEQTLNILANKDHWFIRLDRI